MISDERKFRHFGENYPREIGIWEHKIIFPSFLGHRVYILGGQENPNYSKIPG